MIKNILFYRWGSLSEPRAIANLKALGYHCIEFSEKFADYHADAAFSWKMLNVIQTEEVHLVFSWDYFPLLASVCEIRKIPYASWTYDCPCETLLSRTVVYQCNYLFCFDRIYAERLAALGGRHVYHFPLAVDAPWFEEVIEQNRNVSHNYEGDISFVGRLYNERKKWLEAEGIPEYVKGYLNGITEAQFRIYGYNFVRHLIEEDVAKDILEKADLQLSELYFKNPAQIVADFVNEEITRRERERVAEMIAGIHKLRVYTDSKYEGNGKIQLCGWVDYGTQMPLVFRNSRINLNITSKTIESGIPLRVLDILACGGFCLTNYQPEAAEFFEDGEELVMYTSMEDLANKVDWYLQHEEERATIAAAGHRKVKEKFSLREKLSQMLEIVQKDAGYE